MDIQEVDVFITPDGEVRYEVRGIKGKKCLDVTKDLELALGGQVISREETSEMFQADVIDEAQDRLMTEE
ncbi:MAG: DUF2997 domain-containing protein [Nitrospirota bacterium]